MSEPVYCSSTDDLNKSRAVIAIRAWISNRLHGLIWHTIIHPYPYNFNIGLIKPPLELGHV